MCFMHLFVFLSARTFVCHMCALPMTPKESDGSPGTRVTDSYEPPRWCWEASQDPSEGQTLLVAWKPSLQPHEEFFKLKSVFWYNDFSIYFIFSFLRFTFILFTFFSKHKDNYKFTLITYNVSLFLTNILFQHRFCIVFMYLDFTTTPFLMLNHF